MSITIKVNGVNGTVDVDDDTPLLWVLRDVLGMTGTKFGCGMALCGACELEGGRNEPDTNFCNGEIRPMAPESRSSGGVGSIWK